MRVITTSLGLIYLPILALLQAAQSHLKQWQIVALYSSVVPKDQLNQAFQSLGIPEKNHHHCSVAVISTF